MQTLSSQGNQFYYLLSDVDHDFHEMNCSCMPQQAVPHWVSGASLYVLDTPGLQALDNYLMGDDEEGFETWLGEQQPYNTYSARSVHEANIQAIAAAREEGKLIINHPQHYPCILPLVQALRELVGTGGFDNGYLPTHSCDCSNARKNKRLMCQACYARLVCSTISTFLALSEIETEAERR